MTRRTTWIAMIAGAAAAANGQTVELSLTGSDLTNSYGPTVSINGGRAVLWAIDTQVADPAAGLGLAFLAGRVAG